MAGHPLDRDVERRRALATAVSGVVDGDIPAGSAALALAAYGDGFLAMAIGGVVEDGSAPRLADVVVQVRTSGRHRLDIDLSALERSSPALVCLLGHLRVQQVASGGRIHLHRPPADLAAALGDVPDQLTLHHVRPHLRVL